MIATIFSKIKQKKNNLSLLQQSFKLIVTVAPWQVAFLLCGILLQGIIPSLTIWLSAYIIDIIVAPHHYQQANVLLLCLMWGGFLLMTNLIEPWIICWQSNIADQAVHRINHDLINKSNKIEGLYYLENPEFYNDIQILQSQSSNKPINLVVTVVGLARDFITIFSSLLLLCTVVPWIALLAFASAYIHFKTYAFLQEKAWQESLGRSQESRKINYLSSIAMGSQYAKEVRLFDFGAYLLNEYQNTFKKIYQRMMKLRFKQALWPLFPFIMTITGNLIAFFVVVNAAFHGHTGVGSVALFLQTLSQLHLSVTNFGEQAGWLKGHLLFFEKFFNFLKLEEKLFIHSKGNQRLQDQQPITIDFHRINFSYSETKNILENINFSIKPKEKIAIVGLNGAGKTTLIKLLCGFHIPTSGEIHINGIPMAALKMSEWREKIAPMFQDFNTYALSLEKNIVMGDEKINEERLNKATHQSGTREFLQEFPDGLQTLLGKDFGGIDLSKGQWQKLALARAIYKNSPLLILDEPTASLDPLSEYEIFNRFATIVAQKTVIFVTHRLSSVTKADKILLLHHGKLIAQGTHEQLMETNNLYREMFEKQAEQYLIPERAPITSR